MTEIRLENDHHGKRGEALLFEGVLVATVDTNADRKDRDSAPRDHWTILKLYRTREGAWIVHQEAHSVLPHHETWQWPLELGKDRESVVEGLCRFVLDPLRERATNPPCPPWRPGNGVSGPGSWMVRLLLQRAGLMDGNRRVE